MKRGVKLVVLGVFFLSLLCAGLYAGAWHFLGRDFLSVSEVCRRWWERPLDVAAFRSWEWGELTRAAMACSCATSTRGSRRAGKCGGGRKRSPNLPNIGVASQLATRLN